MSTPTITLVDAARRLVNARATADVSGAVFRARLAEFREQNTGLNEEMRIADMRVAEAEADVKALARAHFDATGEKKPLPGVEIKVYDVLKYDAVQAFAWAQAKGMALVPESLDVKAFLAIAKATPLPFVTHEEDPRVQIGKVIEVPEASPAVLFSEVDPLFGGAP